jgi:hypothetical protein
MNFKHYDYTSSEDFYEYSFLSQGPNGLIKKSVIYSCISEDPLIYNMAFGDVDLHGEINDRIISDNHDRDVVLATVASTINDFSDRYGNNFIFAIGSTAARTRLYQIRIARFLNEVNQYLDLWGYNNDNWQEFERNINYESFLVKRK